MVPELRNDWKPALKTHQLMAKIVIRLQDGQFHSGKQLAQDLGLKSTALFILMDKLKNLGMAIQAVRGRGYRLLGAYDLLNESEIWGGVDALGRRYLQRIDCLSILPSTNDYLRQALPSLPAGTLCAAEAQTAGKGRRGRVWHSPFATSIYASLYWQFPPEYKQFSGLSLVSALAVLTALEKIHPLPVGLGVKWPNDIVFQSAKLGGILLEASQQPQGTAMIIGIGLNVSLSAMTTMGNAVDQPWTDLCRVWGVKNVSRNAILSAIINSLVAKVLIFQQQGFAAFSPLWDQYDVLRGQNVTVTTETQQYTGLAQGVNEKGELCLQTPQGVENFCYGEVSVRAAVC